jgi:trimethylamine-N-oxide reductase (cytochrome c)
MEDGCLSADIVLPINTQYEEYDITSSGIAGETYFMLNLQRPCINPIGDTKSDYEAVIEIAKKLDFYDEYTLGNTVEDWVKMGYETCGWQDRITWEDLNTNQYYCEGPTPGWEEGKPIYESFYNDPVNNPLTTPTGLLEFESTGLLEHFPDDVDRPPLARWIPGGPPYYHDENPRGERGKTYPLLVVCNCPSWRYHAQMDDIPWLREIHKVEGWDGYWYEPIKINTVDAVARGIENGDIVKVYNEKGATLCAAVVGEYTSEGAVVVDHGSRPDYIIPDELDRGGCINLLTPKGQSPHAWGLFVTGFLVEVEKVTGNQMDEWRKNYPDAFKRPYDPAAGLRFEAWVEGGM